MGLRGDADKAHRNFKKIFINMIIIPAINADNFEEIKEKIKLIEQYADWAHLDIADGTFTKNTLWHNPADLILLETGLNLEIHLMLNNVERRIEDWLIKGVKRIIFHIGGTQDAGFIIDKCKKNGVEAGISVSPNESLAKGLAYKDKVDFFQILGVNPGLPGQKIMEETFGKIKEAKKFCPSCIIEVDGGMNRETIPRAVEAGADIIVAASAIFGGGDIGKNIEALKNL